MDKDKYAAQKKFIAKNSKKLGCSFKKEFVDEFAKACNQLGVKQTEVIKVAMQEIIDKANQ